MATSLLILRQSAAEMLGKAVLEVFPGAHFVEALGSEFGFHCDIIAEQPIDTMALPWIEEKMRGYFKSDTEIRVLDMMRENAAALFMHKEQPYIADRVRNAAANIVKVFQAGEFYDYLPMEEVAEASDLKAFKLLEVESVIRFLPEEGHVKVTRIHGAVSTHLKTLKQNLKAISAGLKVRHQEIGKAMALFDLQDDISSLGFIWLPNGTGGKKNTLNNSLVW
jgi:threonyl-tRNA synthetase